jgi:hypothetical protein
LDGDTSELDRRTRGTVEETLGDGLSASQIAAQLGGVSRNAVIGKVHRLKLSGRAKSVRLPVLRK